MGARAAEKYILALGANLESAVGPPETTLAHAIRRLPDSGLPVLCESRLFATPAFPAGTGPNYVNSAVIVSSSETPETVLDILHRIEAEFGRARVQRWGQRCLDLDLIAAGDRVRPDPAGFRAWADLPPEAQRRRAPAHLVLPHPRLQDRAFVLIPLLDIAPDWRHPVLGRTVREMARALPAAEKSAVRPL